MIEEGLQVCVGLYRRLVSLEAFVHESIILLLPTPTCVAHTIAMLMHDYCAIYNAPRPPFYVPHTIYNIGNSTYRVKAKVCEVNPRVNLTLVNP